MTSLSYEQSASTGSLALAVGWNCDKQNILLVTRATVE